VIVGGLKKEIPISMPKHLYLHLCCEGWQRFGPFEWLSFQDHPRAIVDADGTTIAAWDGECWRNSDPKFVDYAWINPTITFGPRHPHPNQGGHPALR
jgi:hypothetical protein